MGNVMRHIRARWLEVKADMVWRRYLGSEPRDPALRADAYALIDRAKAIRASIRART